MRLNWIALALAISGLLGVADLLRADEAEQPPTPVAESTAEQAEERSAQEPGEEQVALSFKDVPIETICTFIEQKLNKPVIPHESIKSKKLTIISSQTRPLPEALAIIADALRQSGIIIQEYPLHIEFLPITEARHTQRRVIGPDESVSSIPEKAAIVDKIFGVEHFDVMKLKEVIVPMLPEYGYVVADPNTRQLIVTDTASNLERIEQVIHSLDVPMADQTLTRIFTIEHGDAAEITAIVRTMIGGVMGSSTLAVGAGAGGKPGSGGGGPPSAATSMTVEPSKTPIVLMPEVSRNWIIAVAPAAFMGQIEEWITSLDERSDAQESFTAYEIKYADISELAGQITQAIAAVPAEDIRTSTRIVPFTQSRRLLVFGSQRGRRLVQSLIEQLDIESSGYEEAREFILQHADADAVAEKIKTLFSNRVVQHESRWGTSYSGGASPVKVTADTRQNSVTVATDPVRMRRIAKLIEEEWDKPLDVEDIQPRVYVLQYADPLRIKELFEDMFTTQRRTVGPWWEQTIEETNPVGRLAGQFSFDALEDSSMLIVTTKSPSNYTVIDRLVEQLDKPQSAGLPRIVELKHANAEDLAEQLNATLSEPGTPAQLLRSRRTLSTSDRSSIVSDNREAQNNNNQQQNNANSAVMTFWWQNARQDPDERPASNLIGMPRFVPVTRRNAVMILAPQAYLDPLEAMVQELDKPGMQVIIHAVIAEVQHDDETTLGMRFAADPSFLSDPALLDSAIAGNAGLNVNDLFGGTFALDGEEFGRGVVAGNVNVSVLIQLLMKKVNLQILFEPKLYTADNQEAEFFDGSDIPVQTRAQSSTEGAATTREFEYVPVGTRLRIRPHITQDGEVDLNINLEVSREAPGQNVFGNPVFDRRETTTHVVVKDGQTVMLSGIIRREDFHEQRKLPLLGDLPLIGGVFRSNDKGQRNRELIAFITPRVIRTGTDQEQVTQQDQRLLEHLRKTFPTEDEAAQQDGEADASH
jgi:general secretion pathway protein D